MTETTAKSKSVYSQWVSPAEMQRGLALLDNRLMTDELKVAEIIAWAKTDEQIDIVKILEDLIDSTDDIELFAGLIKAKKIIKKRLE